MSLTQNSGSSRSWEVKRLSRRRFQRTVLLKQQMETSESLKELYIVLRKPGIIGTVLGSLLRTSSSSLLVHFLAQHMILVQGADSIHQPIGLSQQQVGREAKTQNGETIN